MPKLSDDSIQRLLEGNKPLLDSLKQLMPSGYEVYLYSQVRDGENIPVLSFRSCEPG